MLLSILIFQLYAPYKFAALLGLNAILDPKTSKTSWDSRELLVSSNVIDILRKRIAVWYQ